MKKRIGGFFGKSNEENGLPVDQPTSAAGGLEQQNQAQALQLEIEARQQQIEHLKQEIERLRYRQDRLVNETVQARIEALLAEVAGPVSQLRAQAAFIEQGKPIQARDVLAVAGRIVRGLERHGLVLEGQPGERAAFDPDRHTPLSAENPPQPGSPVVVRFAGVTYQGKILYKAVVEACQDD